MSAWALGVGLSALVAAGADAPLVLDNEHVRVIRNRALCVLPTPGCERRIIVALGPLEVLRTTGVPQPDRRLLGGLVGPAQALARGDVMVFGPADSYSRPSGEYLEVTIRPNRPPVKSPPVLIAPQGNATLYDGDDFVIFEESLAPGETRARHSHRERVVIVLNQTRLQQWPDDGAVVVREQVPDDVRFNPPVVHVVKTIGDRPLRNIVIEFKR